MGDEDFSDDESEWTNEDWRRFYTLFRRDAFEKIDRAFAPIAEALDNLETFMGKLEAAVGLS